MYIFTFFPYWLLVFAFLSCLSLCGWRRRAKWTSVQEVHHVQHVWLACKIFLSSVKSSACHCITCQIFSIGMSSTHLCIGCVMMMIFQGSDNVASSCWKLSWEGTLWEGQVHIEGLSPWQLITLHYKYENIVVLFIRRGWNHYFNKPVLLL